MKNYKVIFMGMLALALVFGLAGCQNGTQEVNGTVGSYTAFAAAAPTNVKVEKNLTAHLLHLTWDAAEDAISYQVYFREVSTKTITSAPLAGPAINANTYKSNGDTPTVNIARDKWNALITLTVNNSSATAGNVIEGKQYQFGVQANQINTSSSIVWSDPTTL
ncbi:hypothetical protein AGMMS50268_39260 [Spirochaetia bacterium]|nr:hypothetical protein AGMMS50268_39260 [Spirochaetia bacterium]